MHHSLILLLLIVSLVITPIFSIPTNYFQLELTHVDSNRQFTKLELIARAARRSQARAKLLSSKRYSNPNYYSGPNIPFHPSGELEYVVELSIGSPPVPHPLLLDTGSGLIWTQCKPCLKCVKQPTPLFDPSKSSTFSMLPCSDKLCQDLDQKNCTKNNHCRYYYAYGDGTNTYGDIATDTFTLGSGGEIRAPVAFGCGTTNGGDLNNSSGIVGFSRAKTSLVSQLGVAGFSYCMTDDINKRTVLEFGTQEEIFRGNNITAPVQTTPFVQDSYGLYFVDMTGITVGTKRLKIPKSVFAQGTIVDSGTAFTQLPKVAFKKLEKALFSKLKVTFNVSKSGVDCYSSPLVLPSQIKVPQVIFHLQGMDMKLQRENYILDSDSDRLLCLSMISPDSMSLGVNIIGNMQQVNQQIFYDLKNNRLAIAPNRCYKG